MANQANFIQKQYEFAAHIRDPEKNPRPEDVEERRMKIYTELFYNNVEDFIANTFPVLREITNDNDWHEMIRDYFSNHQSTTPLFPEMPREFMKYLEEERTNPGDPAFTNELAHYEWVELALMMSDLDKDIDWNTIDKQGDLLEAKPVLSPLAWSLSYQYPVQQIGPDFLPEEPLEQPVHLLVYRDSNDKVHFMELNPVTAHMINMLNSTELTGKQILEEIAEQLQHPQPEVVIQGGIQILNDLKHRDVILGAQASSK